MAAFRYIASAVLVSGVLWTSGAISLSHYVRDTNGGIVNTNSSVSRMIYGRSGIETAIYGRQPLMTDGKKVVMIGASNVRKAFNPRQVSSEIGGEPVHNLASSSGDIRNDTEYVRLAYQAIPKTSWSKTTFVVGIWYGAFRRFKPICIEVEASGTKQGKHKVCSFPALKIFTDEASRYGLYKFNSEGHGITPALPDNLMRSAILSMMPEIILNRLWASSRAELALWRQSLLGQHDYIGKALTVSEQNNAIVSLKLKLAYIQAQKKSGEVGLDEFDALTHMAQMVAEKGGKLVLVDLPLPKWLTQNVPAFSDYQKMKQAHFAELERKYHVSVINMQNGFPDSLFIDDVHPKPMGIPIWSHVLAQKLRPILKAEAAQQSSSVN